MWTIAPTGFTPVSKEKAILGTLTAVFNDGQGVPFTFSGSVNIENQASLADFVVQAKKALAASSAVNAAPVLATVASQLNK